MSAVQGSENKWSCDQVLRQNVFWQEDSQVTVGFQKSLLMCSSTKDLLWDVPTLNSSPLFEVLQYNINAPALCIIWASESNISDVVVWVEPVTFLFHLLPSSFSYRSDHLHSQNLRGGFSLHLCFSRQSPPKVPLRPINKPRSSLTSSYQSTSSKQRLCWLAIASCLLFWDSPYVLPLRD